MKKAIFLRLLELTSYMDKDLATLEGLGIDLQECTLTKGLYEIFNLVMEDIYGKEGLDWILWFIYEKQANPSLQMFDKEGNEIIKNNDELYTYLEVNYRAK